VDSTTLPDEVRAACARVAERAGSVRIDDGAVPAYAASLPLDSRPPALDPETHYLGGPLEDRAAFIFCIDAINFGSGWWPTIRKRPGRSGYFTMATSLTEEFEREPWTAESLKRLTTAEAAHVFGQDPAHELMPLYARALNELGERVEADYAGRFVGLIDAAGGSAVALAETLSRWETFYDVSLYEGSPVPLWKRAQLTAADLHHADVTRFSDLDRLTLFSDNLVPHVLRVDGILVYDRALAARIDREELLRHDSPEEVELRACALHAAELIASEAGVPVEELDYLLWNRGQQPRYKAIPRHRARTTAY
jgi:hypothetical protein